MMLASHFLEDIADCIEWATIKGIVYLFYVFIICIYNKNYVYMIYIICIIIVTQYVHIWSTHRDAQGLLFFWSQKSLLVYAGHHVLCQGSNWCQLNVRQASFLLYYLSSIRWCIQEVATSNLGCVGDLEEGVESNRLLRRIIEIKLKK